MREDTVTTTVYEFDELSDEAKAVALQELICINVEHEWWLNTYEDAENVGLKITSFDEHNIEGYFVKDAESTAQLVLNNHGPADSTEPNQDACETYKDAWEFLNAVSVQGSIFMDRDDAEQFVNSEEYAELCSEFLKTLCEDYRIILGKEYDYLCTDEAIIETIKANEWEFTVDGDKY
jgi:hypothetical protein